MELQEFYTSRIRSYETKRDNLQRLEKKLAAARLAAFIASIVLFYFLFAISVPMAVVVIAAGLFSLGWLIRYQNNIVREREYNHHLATINLLELKSLSGAFSSYADGSEFIDKAHPYSYDLDIFGRASLFQYVNRTISKPASEMLARWLGNPAPQNEIMDRQKAVEELSPKAEWRQKLMALGYEYKDSANHPGAVLDWVNSNDLFTPKKHLRYYLLILSLAAVAAVVLVIKGMPASVLLLVLSINMLVNYLYLKPINRLHQQVSKSYQMLQSYGMAVKLIEQEKFSSARMQEIVSRLHGKIPASGLLHKLSSLVNKFDMRLNIMVSLPLNIFFFWDIHFCYALEKWKKLNGRFIGRWFEAMAEVEVLSSLANLHFNNPGWVMPGITQDYFVLEATGMGHPLIPAARRVNNDFTVNGSGKIVLVTGSNMSGKSTFQRTCGVNMVLAFAGAPVCSSHFRVTIVKLLTSMRISDSLEDNTSSFYAELKRLAMIIRESESNRNVFLLLDEILRGTNSNDRHIGSEALIKQLIQQDTTAILATHDLSLSNLAQDLPGKIDNYNFDVKIHGEELFFDYKLNRGICKSLNASILMKKMGIKV